MLTLVFNLQEVKGKPETKTGTPREVQARLIWANLTAAQVNSSFPYSRRGSVSWTNETEATFLAGAILALQTENCSYLQKANELCKWLNLTNKKNLFYRYDILTESWVTPEKTSYAAIRLWELAVYVNISHQWKPLLQEITTIFIQRHLSSSTHRVYKAVNYDGTVDSYDAGAHATSYSIIALTLSANVLNNNTVRDTAYQLIMNYTLGSANLPYHEIHQDGSPCVTYCKEDENFGLYTLAMETYYYYFLCTQIKNRIKYVVQAGYKYMWNNVEGRWNYRTNADTGACVVPYAVHGFGYTDEAFLQAYLVWKNGTWLDKMKSDIDKMVLQEAIIYNGIIAHDTNGQNNADENWNSAARRTLTLFYSLNYTGFYHNASYLTYAKNLFINATMAHERAKGWQIKVQYSDYADYYPENTRIQFPKWLQYVNQTSSTVNTLDDLYRFFGVPNVGNVYTRTPKTWIVDDNGTADFHTIQEAINNAAGDGDIVFVRTGIYCENVVVNKTISLIGENRETTIIDGNYSGNVVQITTSFVNVTGFTIQHGGTHVNGGIKAKTVSNCSVFSNIIKDAKSNGVGIFLENSSENKVYGNILINNTFTDGSICLYGSYKNIVSENYVTDYEVGILTAYGSWSNLIANNIIRFGTSSGIVMHASHHNSLVNNTISDNYAYGIRMKEGSIQNTVILNNIVNSHIGFQIIGSLGSGASDNQFIKNQVVNNDYGIQLIDTFNSTIFYNNFINNTNQVDLSSSFNNTWDNGCEGNYWSNYNGSDLGTDGIGDTELPWEDVDYYPLMAPYIEHNVGVESLALNKNIVGQGFSLRIMLNVTNFGPLPETFNLTVYANATSIFTHTVTLSPVNSTVLTFTWNTTDFVKGDYTITAYVEPVRWETDTYDNTCFGGIVQITKPGDANGDGCVNVLDLIVVGNALHVYNPNADINSDQTINVLDLILVANRLGW